MSMSLCITRAGTPATTERRGTSSRTTALAPTTDRDLLADRHIAADPATTVEDDPHPTVAECRALTDLRRHRDGRVVDQKNQAMHKLGNNGDAPRITPMTGTV